MDARIAERRAEVRHERMVRRRRRTIAITVITVVIALGVWVVNSPLLALAEVRVTGVHRVEPAAVRAAASLPLGTSTARLPLDAARRRVEALPWVKRARIYRVNPLTVMIAVEERRPALRLATPDGTFLVDGDGVVLAEADTGGGEGAALPAVETSATTVPPPGAPVTSLPAVANAHAVYLALPGPLRTEVRRYLAEDVDDVTLVLRDGARVRFGRAVRVAEKARVLGVLLDRTGSVDAVDVRVPGNPVVVPAGG